MEDQLSPMGPYQRDQWLNDVLEDFASNAKAKFLRGQQEHGGDIGSVGVDDLINQVIDESIDLYFYGMELRRRLCAAVVPPQANSKSQIPFLPVTIFGPRALFHQKQYETKLAKHPHDAGFDLYPSKPPYTIINLDGTVTRINVPTGIHIVIPPGCVGMIIDRSSTPVKLSGATTFGGIIDANYTGEYKVHIHCDNSMVSDVCDDIEHCALMNFAIAQVIVVPFHQLRCNYQEHKPFVDGRGDNGYGSTDQ